MNIIPSCEHVLVLKDAIPEKTEGGIIIKPESDDSTTGTGVVLAVGRAIDKTYTGIAKKKRVLFNKYAGVVLKNDQLLLKQEEILAIIEE